MMKSKLLKFKTNKVVKINIDELRAQTLAAIEQGKQLKEQLKKDKSAAEERRHDHAKTWAAAMLDSVPKAAEAAARKGRSQATIANTLGDYQAYRHMGNTFTEWNTKETGLKYHYLCEELKKLGFKTTVDFCHDGVGIASWYEVVIHWD